MENNGNHNNLPGNNSGTGRGQSSSKRNSTKNRNISYANMLSNGHDVSSFEYLNQYIL